VGFRKRTSSTAGIGEAFSWAGRIVAAGLVMFLPAVAGRWADDRLTTSFLGPLGLILGFVAGLSWLVRMTRGRKAS
jgi:hypothetical protein